ncbi:MAG TPA: DUF2207 domain-containing protein, partial [Chloroflexia bacterium]|nr:DUF2207 domain-containing protein [Chloroflexia bacterium]
MRVHICSPRRASYAARARSGLIVCIAAALLTPILWTPGAAAQATQVQHWAGDDVTIQVHPDSTFDVTERQLFVFDQGTFHGSYRDIETRRLTGLSNVSVTEEGAGPYRLDNTSYDLDKGRYAPPQTFQVTNMGKQQRIIWFYGVLQAPARKTMIIHYTVSGGLRFYDPGDQLRWTAFIPNRTANIDRGQVTVQLPPAINLQGPGVQATVDPAGSGTAQLTPQQAVFTFPGPLVPDQDVEVQLQWPHGLIAGQPAPWQVYEDQQEPIITLLVSILAGLVGSVGPLFWLWRWYSQGRDPAVGLVASTLNAPPSDLPAGLVGTLIDERADVRDIIATILDLGRQGHLRIDELKVPDGGFGSQHSDFQYTLLNNRVPFPHQKSILDALFAGGTTVRLSDLKNRFYAQLGAIKSNMYGDLVQGGFFPRRPDTIRNNYIGLAVLCFVLTGLSFFGFSAGQDITPALGLLVPAFLLNAIALLVVARVMPRKSQQGAAQAARWQAFSRYLADLQHFGDLGQAAQRFGDFLPYAVALGVDKNYVRQFANVQGALTMPMYYYPWGWSASALGDAQARGGPAGPSGPDFSPAGINTINLGIAGAVESLNNGLSTMINSASSVLVSAPSSSGGGGGGGGG